MSSEICERGRNNKNVQNYLQIVCSSVWACGFAKDVPLNSSESSLIKVNYIFIGFCSVIEIHWVEGALKVRLWIFMSMIRNMRLFRDNFPFPLARHRIDIVIIAVVVTAFVAFQCVASAWKGPLALWWFAITATYKWELDLRRAKKDLNWVVKLQIKAKLASSKVLKYTARKHFGSPRWLFFAIQGPFKGSSTIPGTHQTTYYICILVYRILLAHVAAWQLIQKITVAYLIVLFNICILFHFLFSDCAPISTFYSWRPCTFLSMGFLTFCWFTLRWAAEVDAGRSSSIVELGFGLWFVGSGG